VLYLKDNFYGKGIGDFVSNEITNSLFTGSQLLIKLDAPALFTQGNTSQIVSIRPETLQQINSNKTRG